MPEKTPKMLDGKNKILLFRKYGEKDAATKLVFQTEHTFSYSRDMDAIVTKDGAVIKVGELEAEVDIDAIQSTKDPTFKMLEKAMIDGDRLELWEVNIDEDLKEDDKFPAVYSQGFLETWEPVSSAEDEAEISASFRVDLKPQFGMATLSEEQQQTAQYAFRDTIEDGGDNGQTSGAQSRTKGLAGTGK